jgi:hypothetical protein
MRNQQTAFILYELEDDLSLKREAGSKTFKREKKMNCKRSKNMKKVSVSRLRLLRVKRHGLADPN